MKHTYWKSLWKGVTQNIGRFLAIFGIILISTLLISGLGTLKSTVTASLNVQINESSFPDATLISKVSGSISLSPISITQGGFTQEQKDIISNDSDVEKTEEIYSVDSLIDNKEVRTIYRDYDNMTINPLNLIEGKYPSSDFEVVVERFANDSNKKVGDTFDINVTSIVNNQALSYTFTVVGIVENPMNFSTEKDKSQRKELADQDITKDIDDIYYLYSANAIGLFLGFPQRLISLTTRIMGPNIYVQYKHEGTIDYYSDSYVKDMETKANELIAKLGGEKQAAALTINDNVSYRYVKETIKKVDVICLLFPTFFIVVAALVSAITLQRLVNEERGICACFKTLGYSNFSIRFRYIFFSLLSSVTGALIGSFAGLFGLPVLIYPTFNSIVINLPPIVNKYDPLLAIIGASTIIFVTLFIALYKINKELKETPAEALRPKAPVTGKKIVLEKIRFFWNPLPFKFKATLRNIFRFKSKTITMNLSIMCSIALVMAGFGLLDLAANWENTSSMMDTFKTVSMFIICFAVALAILVIYNLVKINVSERVREISTLEVLGYKPFEVYSYVFREIIIMGVFGELLGIPLGMLLLWIITSYLDFGSLSVIGYGTYLYSFLIGFATLILVCGLMVPKIKKIDMISSLKTLE